MARGNVITTDVEALIADVQSQNSRWGPTKVQREVIKRLHDPGDPFYDQYVDPNWPGVSAVSKKLKELGAFELKELDGPFNLGALVKHTIPPEALPSVLKAWVQYRKQGDTLTIREALWFSRLSSVLSEFEKIGDKNRNLGNLVPWYAVRERAYEAIGEAVATIDLDTEVLRLLRLEEEEEDKTLPLVYEDGYLKDATGKTRGQIRVAKKKGGKS